MLIAFTRETTGRWTVAKLVCDPVEDGDATELRRLAEDQMPQRMAAAPPTLLRFPDAPNGDRVAVFLIRSDDTSAVYAESQEEVDDEDGA